MVRGVVEGVVVVVVVGGEVVVVPPGRGRGRVWSWVVGRGRRGHRGRRGLRVVEGEVDMQRLVEGEAAAGGRPRAGQGAGVSAAARGGAGASRSSPATASGRGPCRQYGIMHTGFLGLHLLSSYL